MTSVSRVLALLLRATVKTRLLLYRLGLLRTQRLAAPVISIGNLTAGGTGKTPLVIYLADLLKASGWQPVVLSRGYRGRAEHSNQLVSDGKQLLCDARQCGDEAFLLAEKLKGVPIVVGKKRSRSAPLAGTPNSNTIYVLDDGYQHLSLYRDINLLLVDVTDPFGGHQLLPAGRLREPLSEATRADSILMMRVNRVEHPELIEAEWQKWAPGIGFHHFLYETDSPRQIVGEECAFPSRVGALAAIGKPDLFFSDVGKLEVEIVQRFVFPDHHWFTPSELESITEQARQKGAEALITTEKDAARLQGLQLSIPVFVLPIRVVPVAAAAFGDWLRSRLMQLNS